MNPGPRRYRLRSPLNAPRFAEIIGITSRVNIPPKKVDSSDEADSDTDTAIDDSEREGSSSPRSRETSLPRTRKVPHFAGLDDEAFANQSLAQTIPYEIILNIFRYLEPFGTDHYNCLFVCKSWAKCAVESVWFRPSIKDFSGFRKLARSLPASNRQALRLFPYSQFVRRLNLVSVAKDLSPSLFRMLADCTQLERLTMGGAVQIEDAVIESVVPKFRKLLALDISQTGLGDNALGAIAQNCQLLQGLNVSHCTRITNRSVMVVAKNCRALRRVKLAGCPLLTDVPFTVMATNAVHLLELDLTNCVGVTGIFLPQPPTKINNLLSRRASIESLQRPRTLPGLRELRLGGCLSLDTKIFIPRLGGQEWAALRILDLTQCTRLQDADLELIVSQAPRLRNVVLYKCISLTDRGVLSLLNLGKNLHYLHLGHCIEITDVSVIQLARHCTRLRYLDLASCSRITDISCLELGIYLEKLKRIGLVKCVNIGDSGIFALVRGRAQICTVLERIHLSYCQRLTLNSIANIINYCPNLTHISLSAIPAFLRPEIQELRRPVPADFNEEQRSSFAVFSGSGVHRLKRALWAISHAQEEFDEDAEF